MIAATTHSDETLAGNDSKRRHAHGSRMRLANKKTNMSVTFMVKSTTDNSGKVAGTLILVVIEQCK